MTAKKEIGNPARQVAGTKCEVYAQFNAKWYAYLEGRRNEGVKETETVKETDVRYFSNSCFII